MPIIIGLFCNNIASYADLCQCRCVITSADIIYYYTIQFIYIYTYCATCIIYYIFILIYYVNIITIYAD